MRSSFYKEPLLCMLFLTLMIFEVPFFNLYLIAGLLMLILYAIIYKKFITIDGNIVILLLFITLYFLLDTKLEYSTNYKVCYVISTVSIYICGYYVNFDGLNIENKSKKLEYVVRAIAITYSVYIGLTIGLSIAKGQFIVSRNPLDLWTGSLRASTHYGTMSIIPLAYGIYLIITEKKIIKQIMGWVLVVFVSLVAVITGSRTALFLVPIGLIFAYFTNIKLQGKFTKKHFKQFLCIFMLISFVLIVYHLNVFEIKTLLQKSQLGQRYLFGSAQSFKEEVRWTRVEFFLRNINKSFFGGGYTRTRVGNIHNIYLNVFDLSGIIPFTLLIIFLFNILNDYRKIVTNKLLSLQITLLLFIVLLLSFIQTLLEPTMESVPVFMWCLLLICGMQHKVSKSKNIK